ADARINSERLIEFQMQMFSRGRVHVEFIDCSAGCIQQMRPGLQSLRGYAATASFRFTRRSTVKQSYLHATARQIFGGERPRWSGADNQDIESIHSPIIIVCLRCSCKVTFESGSTAAHWGKAPPSDASLLIAL